MKKEDSGIVGFSVKCKTCGKTKAPRGRSVSPLTANDYCNFECPGYNQLPHPGDLWPGETAEDFGFLCSGPIVNKGLEDLKKEIGRLLKEGGWVLPKLQKYLASALYPKITIDEGEVERIILNNWDKTPLTFPTRLAQALKKANPIKIEEVEK